VGVHITALRMQHQVNWLASLNGVWCMFSEGKVVGLHNWIQIYLEERHGRFDYKGFVR
jgi:hypothetical protein